MSHLTGRHLYLTYIYQHQCTMFLHGWVAATEASLLSGSEKRGRRSRGWEGWGMHTVQRIDSLSLEHDHQLLFCILSFHFSFLAGGLGREMVEVAARLWGDIHWKAFRPWSAQMEACRWMKQDTWKCQRRLKRVATSSPCRCPTCAPMSSACSDWRGSGRERRKERWGGGQWNWQFRNISFELMCSSCLHLFMRHLCQKCLTFPPHSAGVDWNDIVRQGRQSAAAQAVKQRHTGNIIT